MPAHSISSSTRWSHGYNFDWLEEEQNCYLAPFRFNLIPDSLEVGATKPVKMTFQLDVWVKDAAEDEAANDKDLVWTMIGKTAAKLVGTVTVDGCSSMWHCWKLKVEDRSREGSWEKWFTLETKSPLEIRKQGRQSFSLTIDITFQLGGSIQDQIARLLGPSFPEPTPRPGSTYDDSVSLVSQPPNLALQISLTEPNRIHHVWVQEEKLAAASIYLARLVKAVPEPDDVVLATRAFDGRLDFDAVDDDSDDEEDTRRYKLFKESGRVGDNEEDRRSEAPEPAQQNGDGKEPPAKKSKPNSDEEDSDEEHSDEEEEGREMLQAASRPIWPAIMDTRASRDGTQVIGVPDCALSTLQAVIVWIVTGVIVFAPLSSDGKKKRTAVIEASIKESPKRPVPVSPRSVYRLAQRFRLDQLASLALNDLKEKLTHKNAAALSLHLDCKNYPENKTLVHDYVRENWDDIRHYLDAIELKEDYQSILYANLMKPIGGKLKKSYY